jgi:hypothetical protein
MTCEAGAMTAIVSSESCTSLAFNIAHLNTTAGTRDRSDV